MALNKNGVQIGLLIMRLICFWCLLLAAAVRGQDDGYYAPQTYRKQDQRGFFSPARNDATPEGTAIAEPSRGPMPVNENWREHGPLPRAEPWRLPYGPLTKEQQAAIIHHKQSLSSEGSFRFEYASDNGLAAGEIIEPDGSRVGGYQYKDPSGQIVKLKYKAGKDGFQILEGSHLPKSPEPVAPSTADDYYQQAYQVQQQQYQLQKQYNQQQPEPKWRQNQGADDGQRAAGGQYFVNNWRPHGGPEDDGQYRENELESSKPHSFGEGYAFAFKG